MSKQFEVTCIPSTFLPHYTLQTSSFSVPEPEVFESPEKAEDFARKVREQWPTVQCSIREVEI